MSNNNYNRSIHDPSLNHPLLSVRRTAWTKTEPRQYQASSSRSYIDNLLRLWPCRPQVSASGFRESLRERRAVPRQEPTRPEKDHPLTNSFHPPWLTSKLSSSNAEEDTPNLTVDEIKRTVKRLMRGFHCKVPYAYHHRLTHASLSRPTELVRQIPVPAIKYLKKESWPVYNKYIGPPLDCTVFKRRLHIAAESAYVVPVSERQPIANTSSHPRQAREIVSEAKRRYQPQVINRHQQQEQSGCPTPVLEPHRPTANTFSTLSLPTRPVRPAFFSSFGDLKLPGRSKAIKPSSSTAAAHYQPISFNNSIHPLATSGVFTKRKFDAVAPSAMNANKKLKAVHQVSQLMTTFQLAKKPKAVATSSEVGPYTAAPQATVIDAFDASDTTATTSTDADGAQGNAFSVLFVQESHPLGKFKELAMRHPVKVTKVAVKQRMVLSFLKGKEVLGFFPRRPRFSSHDVPSIPKLAAQFPSIPSTSKGKGKEVPLHRLSSSTMNKLPASNPASEASAITSAVSNRSTATNSKASMHEVDDVAPEESEIINPSPPHIFQQACSKHDNKPSYFKPNEAHDNESLTSSMSKGIPTNPTAASTKRVLSVTAPNANTMYYNLAHTYKQRGGSEQDDLIFVLSHLHAFCNYIVSYYYKKKQNTDVAPSELVAAWKSLLPLGDMLLAKLKAQEQYLLYGICLHLMPMVRFRVFNKMQAPSVSDDLLEEYEQAMAMNTSSEKYFNYRVMASKLPSTFKQVCVDDNLLSGVTIGGEAGVQVAPMFPFHLSASLLRGAICTKCILSEFVSSMKLDFTLIDDTDGYM
ncbi:uncharacterized protein RHIMIDRAFT_288181 [Rhizopus microsporus ATCC 52813]|uniref:Uncharacterized protein n=1 Tax=Rhizopus microsporus ATCC 52813 TaxID=1340429 RepID=A0A2G4T894_RHIZD|nr:uncharacterized protein RHIMIDRAFT_288181 [Rhizopus microsporus ATCC 52813]PHZ17243.1 hypothetical protein RHIMIDRAFT_288181 [Rhizopus microsporus ATCC 52813]